MTDGTTDPHKTLAAALGRIPSGLFIITLRHGKRETGMLASWVQQCSFEPPLISAAVRQDRWVLEWFQPGAAYGVNVLAEGQKALLAHFGKGFASDEAAFEGIDIRWTAETTPFLADAHAFLDCRVISRVPAGDHVLVIGQVHGGEVLHEGKPATHVRRSGLHY